MAVMKMPRSEFIPHPEGQHEGVIVAFEDLGQKETAFGLKHKVSVKIESSTAFMDDGQPFAVWQWYTLSAHPKSELRKLREALAGRKLTDVEAYEGFDPDKELIGKRVGFVVVHNEGREGGSFANLSAIWLLKDAPGQPSGPASPPGPPSDRPAPEQVERCVKLVSLLVAEKLYKEADAEAATTWAEAPTTSPTELATFIAQCERTLKAHGIPVPEAPGPKAPAPPAAPVAPGSGSDDGLPF